jgi:hypothetical protein
VKHRTLAVLSALPLTALAALATLTITLTCALGSRTLFALILTIAALPFSVSLILSTTLTWSLALSFGLTAWLIRLAVILVLLSHQPSLG